MVGRDVDLVEQDDAGRHGCEVAGGQVLWALELDRGDLQGGNGFALGALVLVVAGHGECDPAQGLGRSGGVPEGADLVTHGHAAVMVHTDKHVFTEVAGMVEELEAVGLAVSDGEHPDTGGQNAGRAREGIQPAPALLFLSGSWGRRRGTRHLLGADPGERVEQPEGDALLGIDRQHAMVDEPARPIGFADGAQARGGTVRGEVDEGAVLHGQDQRAPQVSDATDRGFAVGSLDRLGGDVVVVEEPVGGLGLVGAAVAGGGDGPFRHRA